MKTTDPPIIISQSFSETRKDLWAALTEVEHMREWFFAEIPDFKAEVGFMTNFDLSNESRTFPHYWKVLAVEPEQSILVQWHFEGYPGMSTVEFSIEGNGKNHTVTVTAMAREDFDDRIPEFKRESAEGGWKYFMNDRLKAYFSD